MDSDDRHTHIQKMAPSDWDSRPASLATEIRDFMKSIKDEETPIDSSIGHNYSDLWVMINDV